MDVRPIGFQHFPHRQPSLSLSLFPPSLFPHTMATPTPTPTSTSTHIPRGLDDKESLAKLVGDLELRDLMEQTKASDTEQPQRLSDADAMAYVDAQRLPPRDATWRERMFSWLWPESRRGVSKEDVHGFESLLFKKLGSTPQRCGTARLSALERTGELKRKILTSKPTSDTLDMLQLEEFMTHNNPAALKQVLEERAAAPPAPPPPPPPRKSEPRRRRQPSESGSASYAVRGGGVQSALAQMRARKGAGGGGGGRSVLEALSADREREGEERSVPGKDGVSLPKPTEAEVRRVVAQNTVHFGAAPRPTKGDTRVPLPVALLLPLLLVAAQLCVTYYIVPHLFHDFWQRNGFAEGFAEFAGVG